MKDNTFMSILLLLGLVIYLGSKVLKNHSNEVKHKNNINILENKNDSLRSAYFKLEFYTIDIENICDKYKSSRDAKYHYHLKTN